MIKAIQKSALSFPLFCLFVLPLVASVVFAMRGVFDVTSWHSLFAHPQLWPALGLSVFTGMAGASLALALAVVTVAGLYHSKSWPALSVLTSVMLAVPHLAVAIGLAFLVMPSGFVARAISVLWTGWTLPPPWTTTHDPAGLLLVAALIIKETPFLIWMLISILNRADLRQNLSHQRAVALSLGHGAASIWLKVFLPQILPLVVWPLVIVFVYGATVVDMALVTGPTQPPTLATLVWADINDAQVFNNARGGVGAVFLTSVTAGVAALLWWLAKYAARWRAWLSSGPAASSAKNGEWHILTGRVPTHLTIMVFALLYLLIAAILLLLSFAALWPFPHLWPETLNADAWVRVWNAPSSLATSVVLAFATSCMALVMLVGWFESQPQARDRFVLALCVATLAMPSVLLALGQYRAFLEIGITGTVTGLFLAHLLPVTSYMFIVLAGSYRSFDPRWLACSTGLLVRFPRFFVAVKLPLLKAPLLAASAVGFAVSFAQYVPAQLVAAGRFSTLPMDAVTLTAGTNRPLTAVFSLLLMMPPLLVFSLGALWGRPRWGRA